MTGRPVSSFAPEPVRRERHVEVSSIVEIDAISPAEMSRMTNMLLAAASGIRVESIYDETRARLVTLIPEERR